MEANARYSNALVNRKSLSHRQIHIRRVIENASAIRAGDHFLLGLASHHQLNRKSHVATAANPVSDADHNVLAFLLKQSLITCQRGIINGGRQLIAVAFQGGKLLLEVLFASSKIAQLIISYLLCILRIRLRCRNGLYGDLSLLHQLDLLVIKL